MTNMAEDLRPRHRPRRPAPSGGPVGPRGRSPRERKARTTDVVIYGVLAVLVLALLVPFIWMVSSSLKENNQVFTVPIQWIPAEFAVEQLHGHLDPHPDDGLPAELAVPGVDHHVPAGAHRVASPPTASPRSASRGRDVLFLAYIGTIAVPWQAYMVPQYIMMQKLGLTNSFTP